MRICVGEAWFDFSQDNQVTLQLATIDLEPVAESVPADPLLKALCLALRDEAHCSGLVGDTRQGLSQASEALHERGAWISNVDIKIYAHSTADAIRSHKAAILANLAKFLMMPLDRIKIGISTPPLAVLPDNILSVHAHVLVGESN